MLAKGLSAKGTELLEKYHAAKGGAKGAGKKAPVKKSPAKKGAAKKSRRLCHDSLCRWSDAEGVQLS